MSKHITCVIDGCDWATEAASEPELIDKVKAHGARDHGVTEISPELAAKVKAAIETR